MNNKFCYQVAVVSAIGFLICLFVLDPLHRKNLQSYNQKHKKVFITCIYCKGTGERVEDINKIMFDAKMALYLNKHLKVDRCDKCVKLPYVEHYDYCDKVNSQYHIFLKEYGAAGPKMEKTSCGQCLGMGQFSSFDIKTQRYLTQQEYEDRERNKMKTTDELKERLKRIVQETFIDSWLDSPNPAFNNKTPRQMVIEQNTNQIEAMLYRLESGIPD
jgi:hypothetical protein